MNDRNESPGLSLHNLSPRDFLAFGVEQLAYIRPAIHNGLQGFSIHAADGTPLAFHQDMKMLEALALQNDLETIQRQ